MVCGGQRWLSGLRVGWPGQVAFEELLAELEAAEERLRRAEARLKDVLKKGRWWKLAQALQALRGVGLWTALTVALEAGDLRQFKSAEALDAGSEGDVR